MKRSRLRSSMRLRRPAWRPPSGPPILEASHDTALAQWERQVERARYKVQRAERRYRAVDPLCGVLGNVAVRTAKP